MTEEQITNIAKTRIREQLLRAATELFVRKGYAATTVREIVAAAGVTKPVLYYYFANKEGIYLELMRETLAKFEALLDTTYSERGKASRKILKLCDKLMVLLSENIQIAKLLYSIYYAPPQGAPFFDCNIFHFKFQDTIGKLINEGINKGELRPENPVDITWTILGVVNIAIEMELCHPDMSLGREGLARLLNLIFDGLRVKAS